MDEDEESAAAEFTLKLNCADIHELVQKYLKDGAQKDEAAFAAGERIRRGEDTRSALVVIFKWKTKGRGISRLNANADAEIADALTLACSARTERAAVAVLCGLRGVDIPVASAILTAIDPERYTVLDFRALEALGNKKKFYNVNFYLGCLKACRRNAELCGVPLSLASQGE